MPKAKHAHTPTTPSPESSALDERLSRFADMLDISTLSARSASSLLDMVCEQEGQTEVGLALSGICDLLDAALRRLDDLEGEMRAGAGQLVAETALDAVDIALERQLQADVAMPGPCLANVGAAA